MILIVTYGGTPPKSPVFLFDLQSGLKGLTEQSWTWLFGLSEVL